MPSLTFDFAVYVPAVASVPLRSKKGVCVDVGTESHVVLLLRVWFSFFFFVGGRGLCRNVDEQHEGHVFLQDGRLSRIATI